MCTEQIKETNFNTCFSYSLDEKGIQIAKDGLNNLTISAPYVFAFVPEINSITVQGDSYKLVITRGKIE